MVLQFYTPSCRPKINCLLTYSIHRHRTKSITSSGYNQILHYRRDIRIRVSQLMVSYNHVDILIPYQTQLTSSHSHNHNLVQGNTLPSYCIIPEKPSQQRGVWPKPLGPEHTRTTSHSGSTALVMVMWMKISSSISIFLGQTPQVSCIYCNVICVIELEIQISPIAM